MSQRLDRVFQLEPEFAEAYARGERWAVQHAEGIRALDGLSSRKFPERGRDEDGTPKNHCGSCPHKDGCMVCDLPYDPKMKNLVGMSDHHDNPHAISSKADRKK